MTSPTLPEGFTEVVNARSLSNEPMVNVTASYMRLSKALYEQLGQPKRVVLATNGNGMVVITGTSHPTQGWSVAGNLNVMLEAQRKGIPRGRYRAEIVDGIAYVDTSKAQP